MSDSRLHRARRSRDRWPGPTSFSLHQAPPAGPPSGVDARRGRSAHPNSPAPVPSVRDGRDSRAVARAADDPPSMCASASARTAHGWLLLRLATGAELEELIAKLSGELEIHRRCSLAHLLIEHALERLAIHDGIAARRLRNAPLLTIGRASIGDAGAESYLIHALADRRRGDVVDAVVLDLHLSTPRRLLDAAVHRPGDTISVEDRPSVHVARGASDGLDQ